MNLNNVFVAFLYNDSTFCEHLIYKNNGKFFDLITNKEINYSNIDKYSIRKYSGNKIITDKVYISAFEQRFVHKKIDIKRPIICFKKNIINNYLEDINKLVELKSYLLMFKKYTPDAKIVNGKLVYKEYNDGLGIYLKVPMYSGVDYCYYNIFTGETLMEKAYDGYVGQYVVKGNKELENMLNGEKVLKNHLIRFAYKVIIDNREGRK